MADDRRAAGQRDAISRRGTLVDHGLDVRR